MTNSAENGPILTKIDNGLKWLARHWLFTFNAFVGTYVMLPIIAPILLSFGWSTPANLIYRVYSPTCHQMAFRSFFLFGEQAVYPRELAGTNFDSFESYAVNLDQFNGISLNGLPPELILSARNFLGNAEMGYKTAICQRDLAIFGFLFIGGLLYALLRDRMTIKPLPILLFIILGMGPIGLDGFSQLFGYYRDYLPLFEVFVTRESTPFMRTATGAWFGFCVAWLALPHIDRGM